MDCCELDQGSQHLGVQRETAALFTLTAAPEGSLKRSAAGGAPGVGQDLVPFSAAKRHFAGGTRPAGANSWVQQAHQNPAVQQQPTTSWEGATTMGSHCPHELECGSGKLSLAEEETHMGTGEVKTPWVGMQAIWQGEQPSSHPVLSPQGTRTEMMMQLPDRLPPCDEDEWSWKA